MQQAEMTGVVRTTEYLSLILQFAQLEPADARLGGEEDMEWEMQSGLTWMDVRSSAYPRPHQDHAVQGLVARRVLAASELLSPAADRPR
jgi:hypothetical protein